MEPNDYRTAFVDWQAGTGRFDQWSLKGVRVTEKGLQMAAGEAAAGTDPFPAGGYNGGSYYNGGAFLVGEALSPVIEADFDFRDAIASWNARTPAGCWIEADISAQAGGSLDEVVCAGRVG